MLDPVVYHIFRKSDNAYWQGDGSWGKDHYAYNSFDDAHLFYSSLMEMFKEEEFVILAATSEGQVVSATIGIDSYCKWST